MQRTAYINKENRVVYIAAFEEDAIKPNAKGKLLFGGSSYNPKTGIWTHSLGQAEGRMSEVPPLPSAGGEGQQSSAQDVQRSAEEVFAVDGAGLGLGDVYTPPAPPAPAVEDKNAALLAEKTRSLEELRTRIMIEKANEETGWQDRVQKLITLRDALIIEIEGLR